MWGSRTPSRLRLGPLRMSRWADIRLLSLCRSAGPGERSFPCRRRFGKDAVHARNIRGPPGKEPERFGGLMDTHAGAAHDPAALGAGALDELGLQRRVYNVRHPMVPGDRFERDRYARHT